MPLSLIPRLKEEEEKGLGVSSSSSARDQGSNPRGDRRYYIEKLMVLD